MLHFLSEIVKPRNDSVKATTLNSSYLCCNCKQHFSTIKELTEHDRRCGVTAATIGAPSPSTNKHQSNLESDFELKDAAELRRHKTHDVSQFVCGIPGCNQVFLSRSRYEKHIQHTCTLCHRQLSRDRSLRRHYRNVHKIMQVLNCDVCGDTFNEPISLAIHNKEKHLTNQ